MGASPDGGRAYTPARTALVVLSLALTLCCSGVIYGFAAFELSLKREGLFRTEHADGSVTYDASQYNTIVSVASAVLAGGSTFVGITLDLGGPMLSVRAVASAACWASSAAPLHAPPLAVGRRCGFQYGGQCDHGLRELGALVHVQHRLRHAGVRG